MGKGHNQDLPKAPIVTVGAFFAASVKVDSPHNSRPDRDILIERFSGQRLQGFGPSVLDDHSRIQRPRERIFAASNYIGSQSMR